MRRVRVHRPGDSATDPSAMTAPPPGRRLRGSLDAREDGAVQTVAPVSKTNVATKAGVGTSEDDVPDGTAWRSEWPRGADDEHLSAHAATTSAVAVVDPGRATPAGSPTAGQLEVGMPRARMRLSSRRSPGTRVHGAAGRPHVRRGTGRQRRLPSPRSRQGTGRTHRRRAPRRHLPGGNGVAETCATHGGHRSGRLVWRSLRTPSVGRGQPESVKGTFGLLHGCCNLHPKREARWKEGRARRGTRA